MKLFGSVCLGLVGFAIAQTPEARRSKYNNTTKTKRPTTKAPTTPYDDNEDGGSTGGASGDPHFMVQSEGREPLCFDFNPPAGSEMNLVVDPESNLVVSAQVNARTRHKTYMTNIHFSSPMGAYLEFDLDGVHLKGLPEGSVSVHPVTGHKQYGDINYAERSKVFGEGKGRQGIPQVWHHRLNRHLTQVPRNHRPIYETGRLHDIAQRADTRRYRSTCPRNDQWNGKWNGRSY